MQKGVILVLSLLVFISGCHHRHGGQAAAAKPDKKTRLANCLETPPSVNHGCPNWTGAVCWVNVEWMVAQEQLPQHDPIEIGLHQQIRFCTNKADAGDTTQLIQIDHFNEMQCPGGPVQPPLGVHPFQNPPHATAAAVQDTGIPINKITSQRCFKSFVVRNDAAHTPLDPHIIISPPRQ